MGYSYRLLLSATNVAEYYVPGEPSLKMSENSVLGSGKHFQTKKNSQKNIYGTQTEKLSITVFLGIKFLRIRVPHTRLGVSVSCETFTKWLYKLPRQNRNQKNKSIERVLSSNGLKSEKSSDSGSLRINISMNSPGLWAIEINFGFCES